MTAIYVSQDGEAGFSAPVIALRRQARLRLTISLKHPLPPMRAANASFSPDSNVVALRDQASPTRSSNPTPRSRRVAG